MVDRVIVQGIHGGGSRKRQVRGVESSRVLELQVAKEGKCTDLNVG